ncbi:MAG: SusD/RagB family nutrient-binding outer membrane lipoprotein [Bacteroidota bacterium]
MKKYAILLLLICLWIPSCDDGFEELNENPLFPTAAQDGPLFNGIIESLRLGWNRQLFLHNEKLYDITELAVVTAETFGNVEGGAEYVWSNYYSALKNARELERRFDSHGGDPDAPNLVRAQLKIIMAYKTFQITDFFGAIPYSEAGRAFDDNSILRPKYDEHESIYKSLIDDLIWASDMLTNSEGQTSSGEDFLSFGVFDTFFGNDRNRWAQFANSLLLRYLVRLYDKEPDYVASRISDLLTSGASFIVAEGDVLMHPREQGWTNQSVNWSFREHNKIRMGSNLWDYMRDDNGEVIDPRLYIFFEPNNSGQWIPFPQVPSDATPQSGGAPYSNARDNAYGNKGAGNIYSSVNYYLIRDELDIPEIIMTSAEVKFLLAEVFLRGIGVAADPFNADFNYQLGILESMEFWQNIMVNSTIWENKSPILTVADFFNVANHPKYSFFSASDDMTKLQLIYTQRWIDAFRQPWEAFSLARQSHLLPREKAPNRFFRFKYPPSESTFNTDNYNEQVSRMGGDENDVKLWWMP